MGWVLCLQGKKNKGQLLAMAAAGFAEKNSDRPELPKFLTSGPAIGVTEPSAGFKAGSLQWGRIFAREEVAERDS